MDFDPRASLTVALGHNGDYIINIKDNLDFIPVLAEHFSQNQEIQNEQEFEME